LATPKALGAKAWHDEAERTRTTVPNFMVIMIGNEQKDYGKDDG